MIYDQEPNDRQLRPIENCTLEVLSEQYKEFCIRRWTNDELATNPELSDIRIRDYDSCD